jgi:hypothetical protein
MTQGDISVQTGQQRNLTREQMIARGAYGFLSRAYEWLIPVDKVIPLLPDPACEDWGAYRHADERQPIEVSYSAEDDAFLLFVGNPRLNQAIARGERRIRAFVEVEANQFAAAERLAAGGRNMTTGEKPA